MPNASWCPDLTACRGTRRTSSGSAAHRPGTAPWAHRSSTCSEQGCSSTMLGRREGRQPISPSRQSSLHSHSSHYTSGQHRPSTQGYHSGKPGTPAGCGAGHRRVSPAHPLHFCSWQFHHRPGWLGCRSLCHCTRSLSSYGWLHRGGSLVLQRKTWLNQK